MAALLHRGGETRHIVAKRAATTNKRQPFGTANATRTAHNAMYDDSTSLLLLLQHTRSEIYGVHNYVIIVVAIVIRHHNPSRRPGQVAQPFHRLPPRRGLVVGRFNRVFIGRL